MATISQEELRDEIPDVLRRVDAGEEFTITVAGRPVAQLGPSAERRWVSGPALESVFETPARETLRNDLKRFPGPLA